MSKSSDGGGGGDGSITVDDDFLNDFATKKIASFTSAVDNSASVTTAYNWANPNPLPNLTPGVYDQVMGGTGTSFTGISTSFKTVFTSLYSQVTAMDTEMQKLSTSLLAAKTTLSNGEDDSLTTAQMLELLNPALSSPSSSNLPNNPQT